MSGLVIGEIKQLTTKNIKEAYLQSSYDAALSDLAARDTQIARALTIIEQCGGIDGAHHKQGVIDQVVRVLTDDKYTEWVKAMCGNGEYDWDEGIAP